MTNKRISDLPEILGAQVANNDLLAIVDLSGFATKKIRIDQISQKFIDPRVDTLVSQVAVLQSQITTINNEIIAINGEISTLIGQVSTNTSDISTLKGQVSTLQSNIVTIEGELVTLMAAVNTLQNQNNLDATTDPTVDDDASDGYIIGSLWINTTTNKLFYCKDTTVGDAVWELISGGGSGGEGFVYINGNDTTDGSWRFTTVDVETSGTLELQVRISGTWTRKARYNQ